MMDRFGRKRCQKKRKDVDYELQLEFFQKDILLRMNGAGGLSLYTYVMHRMFYFEWYRQHECLKFSD